MIDNREHVTRAQRTCPRQQAGHMTEGRQPFTAEIKTLAKGLENNIDLAASPQRLGDERALSVERRSREPRKAKNRWLKRRNGSPFFMTRRRYELTDVDIIAPLLPNNSRGVPRHHPNEKVGVFTWTGCFGI